MTSHKWITGLVITIMIIVVIGLAASSIVAVKSIVSLEENNSSVGQEIGHFIGDIQKGIDSQTKGE